MKALLRVIAVATGVAVASGGSSTWGHGGAPGNRTMAHICENVATGNLTSVRGTCPANASPVRIAGANLFDSLWLTSTGMGTCCNPQGGPATFSDALTALEDAKKSGIRVFRFFGALFGSGNKMWVQSPALYWQQYDTLMDAIERIGQSPHVPRHRLT